MDCLHVFAYSTGDREGLIDMMNEDINDVLKFIRELEHDHGKKIFLQRVYLDLNTACKLHLLSLFEETSRSDISRKAIQNAIKEYEEKNGNLINKAKKEILCLI